LLENDLKRDVTRSETILCTIKMALLENDLKRNFLRSETILFNIKMALLENDLKCDVIMHYKNGCFKKRFEV
jgi:hypothetical protein